MRRGETCYHCRFWLGSGPREKGPKGRCRRYPPVVTDRAPGGTWPVTNQGDACGEWQSMLVRRDAEPAPDDGNLYDDL